MQVFPTVVIFKMSDFCIQPKFNGGELQVMTITFSFSAKSTTLQLDIGLLDYGKKIIITIIWVKIEITIY